ncbi:MAG: immunoglobulin domain-containing protein [Bergeyella sp.]
MMKQNNHITKKALGLMMLLFMSAAMLYAFVPALKETRFGSFAAAAPSLSLTKTDVTCPGNGTITAAVNELPPGAGVTYEYWNNAAPANVSQSSNGVIVGLNAGTYTVRAYVTSGASTQTYQESITLTSSYVPITANSTVTQTCPGASTGTITVNATQGTPVNYQVISAPAAYPNPLPYNQTSNVFTGLPVGVYQIRIYDSCGEYNTITATVAAYPNLSGYIYHFTQTSCTSATIRHVAGHWAFPVTIEMVVKEGTSASGTVIASNTHTYNAGDPEVTSAGTDWSNVYQTIDNFPANHTFPIRVETKITDACGRVYTYNTVRRNELILKPKCLPSVGFGWDITSWNSPYVDDRNPNAVYPITVAWVNTANPADSDSQTITNSGQWTGDVLGLTQGATYQVTITDACGRTRTGTTTVGGDPLNVGQTAFITALPTCRDGYWLFYAGTAPPVAGTPTEHNEKIDQIIVVQSPPGGAAVGSSLPVNLNLWDWTSGLHVAGHYVFDVRMGCVVQRITVDAPAYGTELTSVDVTPSSTCNTADVTINHTYTQDGNPIPDPTTGVGAYGVIQYALVPTGVPVAPSNYQANKTFLNVPNGTYDIYMTFSRTTSTSCNNKLMGQVTVNNTGPQIQATYGFLCQSGANAGKYGITVDATGTGTVEYAITAVNGAPVASPVWQASNEFNGLDNGVYTITVRDNCATTSTVFSTYAYSNPRVRTTGLCPNSDGSIYVPYVPGFTYQWSKDGTPLTNGGHISGADTNILTFAPFSTTDEGVYTVRVVYGTCIDEVYSITISDQSPNSGADFTSPQICLDTVTQPIDLSSYLSSDAQPNGEWELVSGTGGTLTDNMFDVTGITSNSTFVFKYITKGYCNLEDEALITLNFESCACYNPANTTGNGTDTKVGITLLKRAGADAPDNWPMVRKSGHIALESNTKGFVVTRMATADLPNITTPQEGMMVYDTTDKCLKIYSEGAWKCFSTPACP